MTGIRSCSSPTSSFGRVVRIAKVRCTGPPRGFHSSKRPANANVRRDLSRIAKASPPRSPFFHSKNPSAGTSARRRRNGSRNVGFVAAVSARALIGRPASSGPAAQDGTRPQRMGSSTRAPLTHGVEAHDGQVLSRRRVPARDERRPLAAHVEA